jgi:hypothetical protein
MAGFFRRAARSEAFYFAIFMLLLEGVTRTAVAHLTFHSGLCALDELHAGLVEWPRAPVAVFLGSSHAQFAVAARVIDDELGLPRGSTINAGRPAGGPQDQLRVYRSDRRLLGRARVVFLEVGARDFNRHRAVCENHGPDAWRRTAGLVERLRYPVEARTKADWVAGWFVATWDFRATWRALLEVAWSHARAAAGFPRRPEVFDEDGRAVVVSERGARREPLSVSARANSRRHMQVYALEPEAFDALAELVRLVRADGAQPVFVEYPVSAAYRQIVESEHAAAERAWRAEFARRFPDVPRLQFQAEALGFASDDFRDADHLSRRGARSLAAVLARQLRALLPQSVDHGAPARETTPSRVSG